MATLKPPSPRWNMGRAVSDQSKLLAELARAKALFQQHTIAAILTEGAPQSKPDQEQPIGNCQELLDGSPAAQTEG